MACITRESGSSVDGQNSDMVKSAVTTAEKAGLIDTILPGLVSSPKYVPHWFTYDDTGSELYLRMAVENPYYHVYGVEKALLKKYADDMISKYDKAPLLADLGAGNCHKPKILIDAMLTRFGKCTFYPVDVAKDFLEECADQLMKDFSGLSVHAIVDENVNALSRLQRVSCSKLITHFGNSLAIIPMHEIFPFLQAVFESIPGPDDRYLVGLDLNQSKQAVGRAYTNSTWVEFNFNSLTRLNKDFGANFVKDNFEYVFEYVEAEGEMCNIKRPVYVTGGMKSKCDQTVRLGAVDVNLHFDEGEILNLFDSKPGGFAMKWNWSQFVDLAEEAGLAVDRKWTNEGSTYGLASMKRISKQDINVEHTKEE